MAYPRIWQVLATENINRKTSTNAEALRPSHCCCDGWTVVWNLELTCFPPWSLKIESMGHLWTCVCTINSWEYECISEHVRSMTSSNTNKVLTYPEWWTWSISWTVFWLVCQTRFQASVLPMPDWQMCWTFAKSLSPWSWRSFELLWLFFND